MECFKLFFKNTFLIILLNSILMNSCRAQKPIIEAAQRTQQYVPLLKGKKIGLVTNQTSVIYHPKGHTHLVDSLLKLNVHISRIFSPEHGFRGNVDAAKYIQNSTDTKTGLPIISLYGKRKKPTPKDLENIDLMVFDIQDVGVRFYTYISTLHYIMEACAENNIPLLVLDRPNPNGHYVDGPTLNPKYSSFVGKHPVPLVYGMTIGEYAQMINGENWLKNKIKCDLKVIPLAHYTHHKTYHLTIKPSPNLPNDTAINLYPSLGFFEGTPINAGRGTNYQFQRYGSSKFPQHLFKYYPKSNVGSQYPKDKGKVCYGVLLHQTPRQNQVNLEWLIDAYHKYPDKQTFFGKTFTIHAGDTILKHQISRGSTAKEIQKTWQKDLENFKKIRHQYLIYP